MDSIVYINLKKQLDLRPSWVPNACIIGIDGFLIAGALYLLNQPSWFAFLMSQGMLAVVAFHAFGVLHECGHGAVFRSQLANTILGHLASPLSLLPYYPWKFIHAEHHRWTGNLHKDPTLRALRERKAVGKFSFLHRWIWKSWIPVAALTQYFVFWCYPFILMMQSDTPPRRILQCGFSVLWMLGFWTVLLFCFPATFNLRTLGLACVLYFFIVELINLPHHSDRPVFVEQQSNKRLRYWEQHRTTRSCYYPRWIAELLFLNFNFHIEHHFFPSLPWHRLREARKLLRLPLSTEYSECFGFQWNIENRAKDPEEVFLTHRHLDDISGQQHVPP